jgi:hypothetical protein
VTSFVAQIPPTAPHVRVMWFSRASRRDRRSDPAPPGAVGSVP